MAAALVLPLGALVSCTGRDPAPGPTGGPDDPDAAVRAAVADDERALVAAYDAALDADPADRAALAALREQHLAHLAAVAGPESGATPDPAAATAGATAAGTPSTASLARAETRAARQRADACGRATSPDLARLLALIGASEASHAAALRRLA